MSDYADWQGIDRGHEGYWERSVWMGVLKVLNDCGGGADFLNENSSSRMAFHRRKWCVAK